jgi:membrane protein required for colicin V production
MNSFDAVVYFALVVAVVLGFNSGLLRSAVTILAYLFAMPIAIWAMSLVAPMVGGQGDSAWTRNWPLFFGIFLLAGMVLGKLMRMVLDETIGPRAGLVAVTLVMIFDQLVPLDREPKYLEGSRLRPLLSAAGQTGFRSLPPEAAAAIDRLKKERHI